MTTILVIIALINIGLALFYKGKSNVLLRDKEELEKSHEMEILHLIERNVKELSEIDQKWKEELDAYQLTVDNLRALKCEVKSHKTPTTKRKPKE